MLNFFEEFDKFKPFDIEETTIEDNNVLSMKMFNEALDNIKKGNEDIAIIKLKKSITFNQENYDAMKLLALCYFKIGDITNSAIILNRVLSKGKDAQAENYIEILENSFPHEIKNFCHKKKGLELRTKVKGFFNYVVNMNLRKNIFDKFINTN